MGDEPEHLVTELGCLDRSLVETCILDCDCRSLRQRLGETKIALPVAARRGGGDERKHAEELFMPQKRHCHQRCGIHGAQRLQMLRPLGNGFERAPR